MKKQIPFFQNQSNNLSKRTKSLPKLAIAFLFFMCFTTLSFSQTIVDCSAGPVNTTYCYTNNDTTQFVFTSTGGFPLKISSNKKIVEHLAMLGFYDMPLDFLETYVDRINAVTAEQIKEAFNQRVKMDEFSTIVVGPK